MAHPRVPILAPARSRGGGFAPGGGAFLTAAGLPFQWGNSVARGRPLPRGIRYNWGGGSGGSIRREEGVEDADADMEELLARSQKRLLIDVRPPPEWRSEGETVRRKGRELLFREFCLHLGLTPQEVGAIWRGDDLEEKVRDFLDEWGWRYRPLSQRAAVEMLDEHMASVYGRNTSAERSSSPIGPLRLLLRTLGRDPQTESR
ncbi:unnamed protein product [Spirodela intermedia]|uniref:DUF7026 domain-containing protein n=2 Tax=Spirodela intermedia TaxID=51605 RepID=A0A7I8K9R1_SPIIN|nr:unnamed protein product [Spirodela intermedia]CAA6657841.1 unnamed protein product [Spirodela intermedia]CAA7393970.1 unnamed protein product [Spirodela intermedia]